MNLLDIRRLFVEHSGRYDLIEDVEDYADNGADFFIRAGQRVLDNKVNIWENEDILELQIEPNQETIEASALSAVRTIDQVWLFDGDRGHRLERLFLADFVNRFQRLPGNGLPGYFTEMVVRTTEGSTTVPEQGRKIMLGPAPDKRYDVFIRGRFFALPLNEDTNQNFWTMNYPHTLLQAALYVMERFYRNTQGMNDHMAAIEEDLEGIDFEQVETMIKHRSNMADSFNHRLQMLRRSPH